MSAARATVCERANRGNRPERAAQHIPAIRTAVHNTIISSACISIIVLLIAVLLFYDTSRKTGLAIENKAQATNAITTNQPNLEVTGLYNDSIEDHRQSDGEDFMDWGYIAAITDDDNLIGEIVTSFLTTGPESMEEILHAIQNSDVELLKEKVHRFKGGALAVGASHLGEKALRLEQAGEQNDLTQASELFEQLRAEYMKVETFFEQPYFIETIRSKAARTQVTHV